MPKRLEAALKKTARKRGYDRYQTSAYVYGTMREMGWRPKKRGK
jgi:hypothetical protein